MLPAKTPVQDQLTIPLLDPGERRCGSERRSSPIVSLFYGGFRPRRRLVRRCSDASVWQIPDWHEPNLLYLVLGILLLSIADGVLTLNLMTLGAEELNLLMAKLIETDPHLFAATKMCLTGVGLVFLVIYSRHCLFRLIRVQHILYSFLAGYSMLVVYELVLLSS